MSLALYNVHYDVVSSPKTLIGEDLVEIPFVIYMFFFFAGSYICSFCQDVCLLDALLVPHG